MDSDNNSSEILTLTLKPIWNCQTMVSDMSDRLSELPDSLILAILSLLPMKDVVPTMILSKRWLHLWTILPCLKFHTLFKYPNFVSCALANWKGSKIHEFSFDCCIDSDSAIIDSWLLFAIDKQVEELHVRNVNHHAEYRPPQGLYSCSSIEKMSLSYCNLRIDEAVQWNRLKSLRIECLKSLSEDALNRILAGAPLLEELILRVDQFSKNLNIHSTSLKKLKLGVRSLNIHSTSLKKQVLKIWAPNLFHLEISAFFYGICLLDVPSLTHATLHFGGIYAKLLPVELFYQVFQSIQHVEKLTLLDFCIEAIIWFKDSLKFPNAKSLSLYNGRVEEILGVLDIFPNLTTLWAQQDEEVFHEIVEEAVIGKADLPRPSLPYLKTVEINWFMRNISIIPALEILCENATSLDKMVFRAKWRGWCGDKPELLLSKSASSPTAEVTIIHA